MSTFLTGYNTQQESTFIFMQSYNLISCVNYEAVKINPNPYTNTCDVGLFVAKRISESNRGFCLHFGIAGLLTKNLIGENFNLRKIYILLNLFVGKIL